MYHAYAFSEGWAHYTEHGYSTPHGEDDAVAFVQWHVRQVHPEDHPEGISRDDAMSLVKPE